MDLYKFGVYLVFIVSSGPYSETLSKQTFFFFLFYYPSISYQVFPIVKVKYQRKMAFGKIKQTKTPE